VLTSVKPLVSCILATRNRPLFARQAIRCFLRQTYVNAELLVVDDSDESLADLCSGLLQVRHVRLDRTMTVGEKLNIGAELAQGDIIQKLDDDDFYRPEFLQRSVHELLASKNDRTVVAWDCFLVLLLADGSLRFSGHGWSAGGTFCFHKALWRATPFRDVPRAVDRLFLKDARPALRTVCAQDLYILVRHGANTWRMLGRTPVDEYFRGLRLWHQRLEDLIEPIDRPFYASLMRQEAA
jgi:glycosyltransferase involved in cell wall biosynthesis